MRPSASTWRLKSHCRVRQDRGQGAQVPCGAWGSTHKGELQRRVTKGECTKGEFTKGEFTKGEGRRLEGEFIFATGATEGFEVIDVSDGATGGLFVGIEFVDGFADGEDKAAVDFDFEEEVETSEEAFS